jgi:hypothetical protein
MTAAPTDDVVLGKLQAARFAIDADDLSPTGDRATAILERVITVEIPETARPRPRRRLRRLSTPQLGRELMTPEPTAPLRRRRPRRRRMLAGAAAGCVIAGAAVAGVVIVATGGRSADSAADQHVLRAAEIALPQPAANSIVHVSVTQTMTPSARGDSALLVPTVDAEGWFQQGGPRRSVTREQVPGQTPTWQTGSRVYVPATKRVYVDPPFPSSHPRYTLTTHGRDGIITLRISTSYGPVTEPVTALQARALRAGADQILWVGSLNVAQRFVLSASVVPNARSANLSLAGPPSSTALSFPAQLHRLLQSGHAHVDGRVTVDGRTAIKIEISGVSGYQSMTYYVNPTTYRPMELDYYGLSSKDLTRIVFHAYQQLPLKGNAQLLRLPTSAKTTVDHSPADFFHHIAPLVFW